MPAGRRSDVAGAGSFTRPEVDETMSPADETGSPAVDETHQWAATEPSRDLTGAALGDFQVERLLGRGGMGEVYLARQISLNRPVALKVLRPDLLTRPTYLSRFEAEAAAVAKLNHPNIVHVYTLGSVDGVRFIAMEFVQGTNLRDYLRKKGALDYPLALSIMRQAGLAVGAAGEIGLVHRDIKPENLMLTKKGQVKIADFGLCRDLDSADRVHLTQTGITMGTPLYMSPEQAQGHALDHRSDLYSLGVTFYHMLAGVPPFKADTPIALALKHVKDTPASIAVHRPDVPPDLDRLVLKLMAKSPTARYQSAAEMLRDLAKVREAMNTPSGLQPTMPDVTGAASPVKPDGGSGPGPAALAEAKTTATAGARWTEFLPVEAGRPWLSGPARAALIAAGLVAGAAAGWYGRADDLLGPRAAAPKGMPGLWVAPGWPSVPKLNSPEDQYRDAQLRAPEGVREAAWLAVPGHFPNSHEWAVRAYTQLTRLLLRRGDARRLKGLAEDLAGWDQAQTHEVQLAEIARAGVEALDGDVDGVLNRFTNKLDPFKLTDPALMELCLEVAAQAERAASRPGAASRPEFVHQGLGRIQQDLMQKLIQSESRPPGAAARPAGPLGRRQG
jgi:serine/threonine-protein kinase